MRVRMKFSKTDAMRYTGNLDLFRTLERTFRRAGLPIKHSQGFKKRPKMTLASALPLGYTSEAELLDVWLDEEVPLAQLSTQIEDASPPGVVLHKLDQVDDKLPKLQVAIETAEYVVTFLDPVPDINEQVAALLAKDSLPRVRRKKNYDLRPLILSIEMLPDDEAGCQRMGLHVYAQEGKTGRADEVVDELGIDRHAARYHRIAIHLVK